MGEIIAFPDRYESYVDKAERLRWEAVMAVTNSYVDSYDDTHMIPDVRMLAYHNAQHTLRVIRNSQRLAQAMECDQELTALAMLAAAAHDIVQEGARGEMERASADWLSTRMTAEGFDPEDIAACTAAVLGTTPLLDQDGLMTGQQVNQMEFADPRPRIVAQIVASADMGDLYRPYGPLLGRDLYREEHGGLTDDPQLDADFLESQDRQLQLLQNYRYPIAEAEELFGKDRHRLVEYQQQISRMIRTGQITSWRQLIDADMAFCELFTIGT